MCSVCTPNTIHSAYFRCISAVLILVTLPRPREHIHELTPGRRSTTQPRQALLVAVDRLVQARLFHTTKLLYARLALHLSIYQAETEDHRYSVAFPAIDSTISLYPDSDSSWPAE